MLLLPFVSALVLAHRMTWEAVPAAVVTVGAFVIREPLVVLWRQTKVWRNERPESRRARRSLGWYLAAVTICGAVLLFRRPPAPLMTLAAAAGLLTVLSAYLAVNNRQRSLWLQLTSAIGLPASSLVGWLAVGAPWEPRIWWLWGVQAAHGSAALLAVHARLDARISSRGGAQGRGNKQRAMTAQVLLVTVALACVPVGRPGLALALAFSAAVHTVDLSRLGDPAFLQIPLRRVGLRELLLSTAFSALVVVGLW